MSTVPLAPAARHVASPAESTSDPAAASTAVSLNTLWIGGGLCVLLLAVCFRASLAHFVWSWTTDENYSHGFLVPLISLYFAREAFRHGPIADKPSVGLGLAMLIPALLVNLATVIVPVPFIADLCLLIAIAAVCTILLGREATRRFAFAIGFLVFMVPLPVALYATVASPLQLTVSRISSVLLGFVGVPVLCKGNLITLPGDIQMFVAEACSGMRQLTGFLALTTAVVYMTQRPVWHRAILILSSVPIAMTANVVRVTSTGCIMYYGDPSWTEGVLHTAEGLVMMGLGLGMLYGLSYVLDQVAELTGPEPALGTATAGSAA